MNRDETVSAAPELIDVFEEHRPLLTGMAYRMLGSRAEAEDAVQETYLRWHSASGAEIRSPRAWLTTALTRLCIDHLRSARMQREEYKGPWLPEPILTDESEAPLRKVELAESLSMAFLRVLEQLSPSERAAFLLHRVFDYRYREIAAVIGKSEAACRQLVHRATSRLRDERPRFEASDDERRRLLGSFAGAIETGELGPLLRLFAEDIILWSDGGGKVKAALNPIYGANKVARFFVGIAGKAPDDFEAVPRRINGEPGFVGYTGGQPFYTMTFEVSGGKIHGIHIVMNPDKLARLQLV